MKKNNNSPIIGAILILLFIMWKFPTFAMILAIAFTLNYGIKIIQINKEKKKNPNQEISYLTNISNKKNSLKIDVRKAFTISVIILAVSASFSMKSKNKDKAVAPEPAKLEEKQEEVKEESKENVKDEKKEDFIKEAKEEKKELNNEDKKIIIDSLLKTQFAEFVDIETKTEEGVFHIDLYPKGDLVKDITFLLLNPDNQDSLEAWKGVTDMLSDTAKQAREQIDEEVLINFHNPMNKDNVIYSNASGTEFYNVVNDFKK